MIKIDVSAGELFDKITILNIKKRKIQNTDKLINVNKELELLNEIGKTYKKIDNEVFEKFMQQLTETNERLWEIEDEIRKYEKSKIFDEKFIELARSVYINNDERFNIKSKINLYYDSDIQEEKEYVEY